MTLSSPTLLTTEQVATLLSIPTRTIEGWRKDNSGPPYVKVVRSVRYREDHLREWLETMERRPVNPSPCAKCERRREAMERKSRRKLAA